MKRKITFVFALLFILIAFGGTVACKEQKTECPHFGGQTLVLSRLSVCFAENITVRLRRIHMRTNLPVMIARVCRRGARMSSLRQLRIWSKNMRVRIAARSLGVHLRF